MKGWELLKEIAEGNIKEGTKFIMSCPQYEIKCEYSNKTLRYKENNNIDEVGSSVILACDFEIIEEQEEINIQDIKEFLIPEIASNKDEVIWCNSITINKLIKAIKQLDKKIKEK